MQPPGCRGSSSLYRDMSSGRLSYRTDSDGGRSIETSELIRVYGELRQEGTVSRDTDRQVNETQNQVMSELIREIKSLRDEVSGLRNELQEVRRIEDKTEVAEKSNKKQPWWRRLVS
ncbi:entry exclusion protein 1 [Escherichia coli]|nr:entry exclusion protein 1 [Escherichia coli]